MAGIPIEIGGAVNVKQLAQIIEKYGKNLRTLRPFFTKLDANVTLLLERQFESRGRRLETPWQRLAPSTVRGRQESIRGRLRVKRGHARAGLTMPLRDTLAMWASFVKPSGPNAVRVMRDFEYIRGSRDPKAAIHNQGSRRRGRPPRRPIIPKRMPRPVINAWRGMLMRYLRGEGLT